MKKKDGPIQGCDEGCCKAPQTGEKTELEAAIAALVASEQSLSTASLTNDAAIRNVELSHALCEDSKLAYQRAASCVAKRQHELRMVVRNSQ